jgi:hypothetical protein
MQIIADELPDKEQQKRVLDRLSQELEELD